MEDLNRFIDSATRIDGDDSGVVDKGGVESGKTGVLAKRVRSQSGHQCRLLNVGHRRQIADSQALGQRLAAGEFGHEPTIGEDENRAGARDEESLDRGRRQVSGFCHRYEARPCHGGRIGVAPGFEAGRRQAVLDKAADRFTALPVQGGVSAAVQ